MAFGAQGAFVLTGGRTLFRVWAPRPASLALHIVHPTDRLVPMKKVSRGYYEAIVDDAPAGTRYFYRQDDKDDWPDPASRLQPDGVHGPSEVIDFNFEWEDQNWPGQPLSDYIIYELHVGTISDEGTFDALVKRLPELVDLGITAIEVMPVNQFPGERNWGYDGAYLYAAQSSYGGLRGFQRLVNAAHQQGIAVVLDVVYNHLGPEGNYLSTYGPYFTENYKTPWGMAVNFDGPGSDEVRSFFINNALFWINDCHVDALRLDATHAIYDMSSKHFLHELSEQVKISADRCKRRVHLIAETDLNDVRFVRPIYHGGLGMNGQWNDDYHHALLCTLPGADCVAYTKDYFGFPDLVKSFREGYVFTGRYSPHRQRKHGVSSRDVHGKRMVIFIQNHDQVGNRAEGDRLTDQVSLAVAKVAAGAVLLAPYVPLLFMGEEYGEKAPFNYFVSHSDPDLIEAVRKGRAEEFKTYFQGREAPDPQSEQAFLRSKLNFALKHEGEHAFLYRLYKELIKIRKNLMPLTMLDKEHFEVIGHEREKTLVAYRWWENEHVLTALNFSTEEVAVPVFAPAGTWKLVLDSEAEDFGGSGCSNESLIESKGHFNLRVKPCSFVALYKEDQL